MFILRLHIEPFNNYLQTIYYDKKQVKRQGYIAVKLEYRCRICRVDLNVRIIFKRFSFAIKCKGFKSENREGIETVEIKLFTNSSKFVILKDRSN